MYRFLTENGVDHKMVETGKRVPEVGSQGCVERSVDR